MLTYKNVRIVFYTLVSAGLAACWILGWSLLYLIPLVIIYLGFIAYGSYFIQSGFFLDAVCSGKSNTREIAITFDDGPSPLVTPQVLDLLKTCNAKATFFCIGKHIEGNEDLLRRMALEGHEIGNHSWSHSYLFDFYRAWKVEDEIASTSDLLFRITGKEVKYFRPPFGATNPVIADVIRKLKMPVIGWSIRSYDTMIKNPDTLFKRITCKLKPGDIVLFHDSNPRILPVLKKFLDYAQVNGYSITGLDKLTGYGLSNSQTSASPK